MDVLIILTTIFSGIAAIGAVINIFVFNKRRRQPVVREDTDDEELRLDMAERYHQMYGDRQGDN